MDTEALRASPEVGQGAGKAVRSVWIQQSTGTAPGSSVSTHTPG